MHPSTFREHDARAEESLLHRICCCKGSEHQTGALSRWSPPMLHNCGGFAKRPEQHINFSSTPICAHAFNLTQHIRGNKGFPIRKGGQLRIAQPMSEERQQQQRSQVHVVNSVDDIRITAPNVELESFPDHLPKRCILFHYPETERLARSIAAASGSRVELGDIKWG